MLMVPSEDFQDGGSTPWVDIMGRPSEPTQWADTVSGPSGPTQWADMASTGFP
ncbi:MAG TPA: hypothetical protein VNV87_15715 [Acidimicrobiales bacterium]|nr:hypothetical protein [Acidimicrobiales bacterium]